jgi:hypothetical protein
LEGLGKKSSCKYVASATPDVQVKYTAELATRAAGKALKKKTGELRSAIRTRDFLPTHALHLFPSVIHPREHPAYP